MQTIGAFDAKTHLSRLLDEVTRGESFTITKHGVPVAQLVPLPGTPRKDIDEVIAAIKEFRKTVKPLDGLTIREMIEEGRRY